MANQTILIIRHAEKPEQGGDTGVTAAGVADKESLTPTGWQRAGAWAELFVPSLGGKSTLPTPKTTFASAPATKEEKAAGKTSSKSERPLETITPLAAKLGIKVDLRFSKGDEADLAKTIEVLDGVALVCWQHEDILAIASAFKPKVAGLPDKWPGDRFNVIFSFERADSGQPWTFQQIVPVMLHGDKASRI